MIPNLTSEVELDAEVRAAPVQVRSLSLAPLPRGRPFDRQSFALEFGLSELGILLGATVGLETTGNRFSFLFLSPSRLPLSWLFPSRQSDILSTALSNHTRKLPADELNNTQCKLMVKLQFSDKESHQENEE